MEYIDRYDFRPDAENMGKVIAAITENAKNLLSSPDVLKKCFSLMDLTSLNGSDTVSGIRRLVRRVNEFHNEYPELPLPASVCVYPNFASTVVEERLDPELHATVVSACFPASQSFIEVKCLECSKAVEAGADEVDVVLALNSFLDVDGGKKAFDEIRGILSAIDSAGAGRHICLKVILETGVLSSPERIAEASFLAMEAGADFIKTSTGKVAVNATPEAALVMCMCIRRYYEATGRKVGFKAAGGISTPEDAVLYYAIVSSVLGDGWLDRKLFRFGVSRLADNLLSAILCRKVEFFSNGK